MTKYKHRQERSCYQLVRVLWADYYQFAICKAGFAALGRSEAWVKPKQWQYFAVKGTL